MDLQLAERIDYYLAQADVGLTLSADQALHVAGQVLWATRMAIRDLHVSENTALADRLEEARDALDSVR